MAGDMTTTARSIITAEELERPSVPGKPLELVRGQLIVRTHCSEDRRAGLRQEPSKNRTSGIG